MYREVTMLEIKEALRLWLGGMAKKRIAAQIGLDPKTVRRYVAVAEHVGLQRTTGPAALTDDVLTQVLVALHPLTGRPRGESWATCAAHQDAIARWLTQGLRLTKIRKLLARQGISVPYPTLHRYAVTVLQFGRTAPTVPVVDGVPGHEVQVDTGWVGWLSTPVRRRRFRAWIFTAVCSRYRFVYPVDRETTATAIEACEAAWQFFGGVFAVLIPDNTKAIVAQADPLVPRIAAAFLEYAQARGFHIDPARVRRPQDKARVERAVPTVRDDCFAGETLADVDAARTHAVHWCRAEYGLRRHTRTQRLPREHFDAEEHPRLQARPTDAYDPPVWSVAVVGRDQHAQVARALYSLPATYIGRRLRTRADRHTVRFYEASRLVKTHPRQPPGGRATDPPDLPAERRVYALRDTPTLLAQATEAGPAIGRFAAALLDSPLPWTRMRHVYALLGLVRRYGATRVETICAQALAADLHDVTRLTRMLAHGTPVAPPPAGRVLPIARFLRPSSHFRLARVAAPTPTGDPE